MAIRHDRKVSILDVMGPVMVGPSSSHTAGTARLGRVAREILDEDPVAVRFHLHPPLAATYRGHGSDFALVGGSIGLNVDDPRIPEALRIAEQMEVEIEFHEEDLGEVHPNTVRIEIEADAFVAPDHCELEAAAGEIRFPAVLKPVAGRRSTPSSRSSRSTSCAWTSRPASVRRNTRRPSITSSWMRPSSSSSCRPG